MFSGIPNLSIRGEYMWVSGIPNLTHINGCTNIFNNLICIS